eukprot:CAMPEP_0172534308 /NCGR_PEP_ID=MMETSP1067-20121228/6723_1 /TAXON_ID=265564 ORGANISM="Thalassiosira punctigera, Strain Tpunct2005C2" /NCGR_SAMPLE_ID=MMETSP1067 /ASSEMBLY_ACC=CAM_ASM_000444 /LENGTH=282 /DNA_ID=CAMNT_0013319085 /DNA_START=81 /DNA_END=929 /DNA_ORIENTATION=+
MGSVFGKESVAEPPYDVLLRRRAGDDAVNTPYELRRYQERFAASVTYPSDGRDDDNNSPFRTLAGYIGVFGNAQNEGSTSIAMTAPVVMERDDARKGGGESIAMTAPVVMENGAGGEGDDKMKKMMFMLPAEYDSMSKIPKPINPAVHIEQIPSEVGVVHRYNGRWNDEINRQVAKNLGDQLVRDGVAGIDEGFVMDNFQFWGYNPPYTLPHFRRNEVWLKLNDDQVNLLKEKFPTVPEGGLVGGSSSTMRGRTMFALGACGLVGAIAVGLLFKTRTQYRRI